jgi:hypothetical protein
MLHDCQLQLQKPGVHLLPGFLGVCVWCFTALKGQRFTSAKANAQEKGTSTSTPSNSSTGGVKDCQYSSSLLHWINGTFQPK